MILLSHGNSGTIYAYDAPYPTQKLWEPFTADRAPSLAGKPKFFFIQVNFILKMNIPYVPLKMSQSGFFKKDLLRRVQMSPDFFG